MVSYLMVFVIKLNTIYRQNFESSLSSSLLYLDKGEKKSYNISLTTTNYQKPGLLYQLYPQGHASVNITVRLDVNGVSC